ncbi:MULTISPECIES: HAD family hydrolase [Legionella]|uniref:HAD family phosphatase n=1 Tax=Legionella septentrionalis TaxID=2498109 RepID=A0A3S0WRD5_9GAMM|nr:MULTISPECIES: HAD family phosphatase [Legionella]MCP0913328.1 HAD family phosphatase [Legionella sp. 27cVA30]RUQ85173.1 HAD family phosphatase [Legionella septentrionalis]RUQ98005.1 HAD family phosphatase [Legionella septentrionalis]RUR09021.1 HAD family phosphatase [Legionella septentrionalis]RUR14685.1 HAD family phosphatase [Legionella septentrionalis]
MGIKNIIFDLGGVILNLDYKLTEEKFHRLSVGRYNQKEFSKIFDDYETGKLTSSTFRKELMTRLDLEISEEEFDSIWNALLIDIPVERLEYIKKLRSSYNTFLFSNTNEIHLKEILRLCERDCQVNNFEGCFNAQYFSHIFGMRKPHVESFTRLLNECQLNADETVFIDDLLPNVQGAKEAGLHTIHFTSDRDFMKIEAYIAEMNNQENVAEEVPTNSLVI